MSSNSEKADVGQASEFQDNLNMLRQAQIFSVLPLDALKVFTYLCGRETFRQGDYLFQQGEDDGQAFYFISGKARLLYRGNGTDLEIADHEVGDFIGALSLLGKTPRLFSLKALTDTTCLIMTRNKFAKVVEQFPELMPKILNALVGRISQWEKKFLADHWQDRCGCVKRTGVSLI